MFNKVWEEATSRARNSAPYKRTPQCGARILCCLNTGWQTTTVLKTIQQTILSMSSDVRRGLWVMITRSGGTYHAVVVYSRSVVSRSRPAGVGTRGRSRIQRHTVHHHTMRRRLCLATRRSILIARGE